MLTPDDGRSDGRFIDYLQQPRYRRHDPVLYDALSAAMATGSRHLDHVSRLDILPGARFHAAIVPDGRTERARYFESVLTSMAGVDLLFFDPDNGIEVTSKPRGRRDSSKYLFWDEIEAAYRAGHSLLIYQHYPRQGRAEYTARMAAAIEANTGCAEVLTFATSRVLFLLAAQERHGSALLRAQSAVNEAWQSQINTRRLESTASTP
jgi:hypothetical protein